MVKNKHYRAFKDAGHITLITVKHIEEALKNVKKCKHAKEGAALLLLLYYTGARPNEVLNLRAKDVVKKQNHLLVSLRGSKGGLPRTIHLPFARRLVKKIYDYVCTVYDELFLFHNYRTIYVRRRKNVAGDKTLLYEESTNLLRYYFKKWFKGVVDDPIPPYYLRHNRFSQLSMAGIDLQHIRMLKGSRSVESVMPYVHLSTKMSKHIATKIK